MPLFNDRRNTNPAVEIADLSNKNKRDVMNYTTPSGFMPGANLYGATYKKANNNGSRYATDMASTSKQSRANAALQKSYINKAAAASEAMNKSKSGNKLVKGLNELGFTTFGNF
jgi:hypothetical protein